MKGFPFHQNQRGLTLIELVVTMMIISILAAAVLPLSQMTVKRSKELELRKNLRMIRTAIDRFKKDWDKQVMERDSEKAADEKSGYPRELEFLVAGVPGAGENGPPVIKYLRRVPKDPMTGKAEWGLRCLEDAPDASSWCGTNVYDVYSKSGEKGMDGSTYATW